MLGRKCPPKGRVRYVVVWGKRGVGREVSVCGKYRQINKIHNGKRMLQVEVCPILSHPNHVPNVPPPPML